MKFCGKFFKVYHDPNFSQANLQLSLKIMQQSFNLLQTAFKILKQVFNKKRLPKIWPKKNLSLLKKAYIINIESFPEKSMLFYLWKVSLLFENFFWLKKLLISACLWSQQLKSSKSS